MLWHKIHHWFIPHKDTHKKAHLLSWEALLVYVLLFIFLQVGFSIVGYLRPGILGITSNISQQEVIELTNVEREKKGLPRLLENEALNKAAKLKAENMFEENYWSHFAPSGQSPWDFILGVGYRFTFAGENLAKNFYSSQEVVNAWLNSPTHRDNLLNAKYQDIGIAVVEGVLNGQKTTLVVQQFGTTRAIGSSPVFDIQGKQTAVPKNDLNKELGLASVLENKNIPPFLIDPFKTMKTLGLSIVVFLAILLALDIWILKRRGVFRISSHHIAHMTLLAMTAGSLFLAQPGSIL